MEKIDSIGNSKGDIRGRVSQHDLTPTTADLPVYRGLHKRRTHAGDTRAQERVAATTVDQLPACECVEPGVPCFTGL